jgi:hypothetical protein
MRVAFCRAAIDMNLAPAEVLVAAHAHPLRTEGDAVGVEFDALFIEQMRIDLLGTVMRRSSPCFRAALRKRS